MYGINGMTMPNMQGMQNMQGGMTTGNMMPYQPYSMPKYPVQQQPARTNVEWINVNGIQEAQSVQVESGRQAWLMDRNQPIFYVKQANDLGVCTLKAYRFEEIDPQQPNGNEAGYVTREEFESLRNEIRALQEGKDESNSKPTSRKRTAEPKPDAAV